MLWAWCHVNADAQSSERDTSLREEVASSDSDHQTNACKEVQGRRRKHFHARSNAGLGNSARSVHASAHEGSTTGQPPSWGPRPSDLIWGGWEAPHSVEQ
eukprot:10482224-Alexandrium_andersonii.AAC.1